MTIQLENWLANRKITSFGRSSKVHMWPTNWDHMEKNALNSECHTHKKFLPCTQFQCAICLSRREKKKLKLNRENVSNCGLYLIFLLLVLSAKKNRPRFPRTTTTKNTRRIYRAFVLRIESVPLILIEMPLIKWTITWPLNQIIDIKLH